MEDVLLYKNVKIALAVTVIRRKPRDLSIETYIEELLKKLQSKDYCRNIKVRH